MTTTWACETWCGDVGLKRVPPDAHVFGWFDHAFCCEARRDIFRDAHPNGVPRHPASPAAEGTRQCMYAVPDGRRCQMPMGHQDAHLFAGPAAEEGGLLTFVEACRALDAGKAVEVCYGGDDWTLVVPNFEGKWSWDVIGRWAGYKYRLKPATARYKELARAANVGSKCVCPNTRELEAQFEAIIAAGFRELLNKVDTYRMRPTWEAMMAELRREYLGEGPAK